MSKKVHVISPFGSRAAVRAIFAGLVTLSASTVIVPTAHARSPAGIEGGQAHMQAAVGHRQPTRADVTTGSLARSDKQNIARDNERLGSSPSQAPLPGADQVQSEEDAAAKAIEQENVLIDRLIRGICRGC